MTKRILILVMLSSLIGCAGATFEKGLNYEKTSKYIFDYNEGTQNTVITNKQSKNHISVGFNKHYCGFYGLIGPLIFPIIPFWENHDCNDIILGVSQASKVYIIYNDKVYQAYKTVRGGGYFFPLPIKSITDTAILVVEKQDGEKFKIPFRYQHSFSFDLWP